MSKIKVWRKESRNHTGNLDVHLCIRRREVELRQSSSSWSTRGKACDFHSPWGPEGERKAQLGVVPGCYPSLCKEGSRHPCPRKTFSRSRAAVIGFGLPRLSYDPSDDVKQKSQSSSQGDYAGQKTVGIDKANQ